MIVLPTHITYTVLKSFWAVFWVSILFLAAIAGLLITGSYLYLALLLPAPLIVAAGFKYPELILQPYIYFNALLKRIARLLRTIVLTVMHYLVLAGMKAYEKEPLISESPPEGSMWTDKKVAPLLAEDISNLGPGNQEGYLQWIRSYSEWCTETGRWWLLSLLPFLILLSVLAERKEPVEIATDTYTLY